MDEGVFLVSAHLFGGMCTGEDVNVTITYATESEANVALATLKELERIAYETIEELEPAARPAKYAHLMEQIRVLGLEAILPKMFDEELEIGDIRMIKSPLKTLVFAK